MERSGGTHYRALAEECARRAELTDYASARTEWLRLAKLWEVLADNAKPTGKNLRPVSPLKYYVTRPPGEM